MKWHGIKTPRSPYTSDDTMACENVCFLGPCQAGKTHLIHQIAGRLPPTAYSPTIEEGMQCPLHNFLLCDTSGTDSDIPGTKTLRSHVIAECRFFVLVMPERMDTQWWDRQVAQAMTEIQRARRGDFYFVAVLAGRTLDWQCPPPLTPHFVGAFARDNAWTPQLCIRALRHVADQVPTTPLPKPRPDTPPPTRDRSPLRKQTSLRRLSQFMSSSVQRRPGPLEAAVCSQ